MQRIIFFFALAILLLRPCHTQEGAPQEEISQQQAEQERREENARAEADAKRGRKEAEERLSLERKERLVVIGQQQEEDRRDQPDVTLPAGGVLVPVRGSDAQGGNYGILFMGLLLPVVFYGAVKMMNKE